MFTLASSRVVHSMPLDTLLMMYFERARLRRSLSLKDGLSELCVAAHGPCRCTSGTNTVLLSGSSLTENSLHAWERGNFTYFDLRCIYSETTVLFRSCTSRCRAYCFWLRSSGWHRYKAVLLASMSEGVVGAKDDTHEQRQQQ